LDWQIISIKTSINLERKRGNQDEPGSNPVPTLILAGAKDSLPLDWERRYASQIKGCRFEVWEEDGHLIPLDSPQRVGDLLVSFIEHVSKE